MKNKLKLGIFSWFGFLVPLPERLRLIKKARFDATSIWWEDENSLPIIKKEQMACLVKDSGLVLENIHVPFNSSDDLWSNSGTARARSIKEHTVWLHDCAAYDIPCMVMHLTESTTPPVPNQFGIESITSLVVIAKTLGVRIAIENTRREDNVAYVLSEIESGHLGYCYDSSHASLKQDKSVHLLKKFGKRMIATHLSDNDGKEDRHWLPGNGTIDWSRLAEMFPKETYQGYLTLETLPDEEERRKTPEEFLEKAFRQISWVRDFFTGTA